MNKNPAHFKGKDAIAHVIEAQATGLIAASEIHGTEIPGHIGAFVDAMRDTCIIFLLFSAVLQTSLDNLVPYLAFFLAGWALFRGARAAWMGWFRLERLHRVLEQEKWEIEHNRPQERDELRELYRIKGFEGRLLEDVLDVLMADGDRLLRVMVEEELGLSLQKMEHPLKQGLGAFLGDLVAGSVVIAFFYINFFLAVSASFAFIAGAIALLAFYARNGVTPAIIWNLSIAGLCFGVTYYLTLLFRSFAA